MIGDFLGGRAPYQCALAIARNNGSYAAVGGRETGT